MQRNDFLSLFLFSNPKIKCVRMIFIGEGGFFLKITGIIAFFGYSTLDET